MDPANISWLEANPDDTYWEADHRRSNSKGDSCLRWDYDCLGLRQVSRYYEELGDDLGRHERMAEAMYDC